MREYAAIISATPITLDTMFHASDNGDTIRSSVYHALHQTLEEYKPSSALQTEAIYQILNIIRAASFA
jgi:hypothetical protein